MEGRLLRVFYVVSAVKRGSDRRHKEFEAVMESQCRVAPDRVKEPGQRWDADNAESIKVESIKAHALNKDFRPSRASLAGGLRVGY